jgi:hypothetical protein
VVFRSTSNRPRSLRTKRRRKRREYDLRLPDRHVRGVLECYAYRITHDQHTLEHRYKNEDTADFDIAADSGDDDDARGFEFTTS